jgi:hypothetical protein
MKIARKKNAKKQHDPWWNYMINVERKPIETTFSELSALLARKIHAVTQKGFLLKVVLVIFNPLRQVFPTQASKQNSLGSVSELSHHISTFKYSAFHSVSAFAKTNYYLCNDTKREAQSED